jgi:hypothetical protein
LRDGRGDQRRDDPRAAGARSAGSRTTSLPSPVTALCATTASPTCPTTSSTRAG